MAFQLAKSKAKLVCWDVLKRENEQTVNSLRRLGCEAYAYQLDVSDRHQVEAVGERVSFKNAILIIFWQIFSNLILITFYN